VPPDGDFHVSSGKTAAVVGNPEIADAAVMRFDRDFGRTGVERVLDQFLGN